MKQLIAVSMSVAAFAAAIAGCAPVSSTMSQSTTASSWIRAGNVELESSTVSGGILISPCGEIEVALSDHPTGMASTINGDIEATATTDYDSRFPEHPPTRVRSVLAHLEERPFT